MFGLRNDGKKVKGMGVIETAEPFFMPMRIDAVNYITVRQNCSVLDDFIQRERKNGVHYNYMHLVIATLVRLLYLRPKLNRFIMRGTTYQRNKIMISMDIKKKLEDEGENVTLKFEFTGRESISQIKEIVDKTIAENMEEKAETKTTKFIKHFTHIPPWLFRWAMAIFRWMDKHGLLTKGLIKASPFHTSIFVTNLKSIRLGYIYHHLYNFGTTSIFVAMGKERMMPIIENNKDIKVAKMLELGISLDERIADGFYMGKSLRLMQDILANLDTLKEELPEGEIPTKIKKKSKRKSKPKKVKKERKSKSIIKKSKLKKMKEESAEK